jgi:hypothetical protein
MSLPGLGSCAAELDQGVIVVDVQAARPLAQGLVRSPQQQQLHMQVG